MDVLSASSFEPMCLSRNPIEIPVTAFDIDASTRAGIRYFLEIYLPEFFRASSYVKRATQEGSEQPPYLIGSTTLYPGATFSIEEIIDSYLELKRPVFGQSQISVCDAATTSFYTVGIAKQGAVTETQENTTQYALKAGINEKYFAEWKDTFFTDFVGANRKFMTFQPTTKHTRPESPEFLYWLSNVSPVPNSIILRVEISYEDSTTETVSITELAGITAFTLYCVPVGALALGLDAKEKVVVSYKVWLANEDTERLTEIREYILDYSYKRNIKYIIFQNSIGGYDTICLTGRATESMTLEKQIFEREPLYDHLPTYAERVVNKTKGIRELVINTGWFSINELSTYSDLLLSKDVLLVTDREYIPLIATNQQLTLETDDEVLIGRELTFQYANRETNISPLPIAPPKIERPTAWRPYQFGGCLIDANGRRMGLQEVNLLEKYYLDDATSVIPAQIKPNTPDTEGYIASAPSTACALATTPYLSVAINRVGSFNRNNCPGVGFGSKAIVKVLANAYGSERSQADADAKAEAAWKRLNTQAYANDPANGATCSLTPEGYFVAGVPSNYFNYRWFDKAGADNGCQIYGGLGVYSGVNSDIVFGSGWSIQGNTNSASVKYPQGTNDAKLPCDSGTSHPYQVCIVGLNTPKKVKIYYDGVLKLDRTIAAAEFQANNSIVRITLTGATYLPIPSGCMMYVSVENA